MPVNIGRWTNDGRKHFVTLAEGSWDLREQIGALEAWLEALPEPLVSVDGFVADIGFHIRKEQSGGGPPISLQLMERCLESRLEIFLSQYGGGDDD